MSMANLVLLLTLSMLVKPSIPQSQVHIDNINLSNTLNVNSRWQKINRIYFKQLLGQPEIYMNEQNWVDYL
jgi:hypothetical protein